MTQNLIVNGEPWTRSPVSSIADIVAALGHDPALPGVAVAVDGEVLRRKEWPDVEVEEDMVVEVVTAVQGGAR